MTPRSGQQVHILSAVNEIMMGRTQGQTIAALQERFTYMTPQQAALTYEQAQESIDLAAFMAEAGEGARMSQITGLTNMPEGARFVKVQVESNVKPGFEQQAGGLTNHITIHVPYSGDTSVEELEEMIRDAAEEAAGEYAGAFFEGINTITIVGVF